MLDVMKYPMSCRSKCKLKFESTMFDLVFGHDLLRPQIWVIGQKMHNSMENTIADMELFFLNQSSNSNSLKVFKKFQRFHEKNNNNKNNASNSKRLGCLKTLKWVLESSKKNFTILYKN
jgi:hypothetical protein